MPSKALTITSKLCSSLSGPRRWTFAFVSKARDHAFFRREVTNTNNLSPEVSWRMV